MHWLIVTVDAFGAYFALFIDSEGNRLALHEGPTRTGVAPKPVKAATKVAKQVKKAAPKSQGAAKVGNVAKKAAKKKR